VEGGARDPVIGLTEAEIVDLAEEAYRQRNDPDAWEDVPQPVIDVQHDWQLPHRATAARRCTRCELWEVPYSRDRPCLGRPLRLAELRRELEAADVDVVAHDWRYPRAGTRQHKESLARGRVEQWCARCGAVETPWLRRRPCEVRPVDDPDR
jgi:hypothetical protein